MKNISVLALSVALALGLTGCEKAAQAPAPAAAETAAVAAAPAKALVSGVEQENFDPAVKHTENFFYSVNGTWLKNTEIPADKSNYGSFTKLYDDSQVAMRTIIESAAAKKDKVAGTDEQKLGDFYNSYMDEAGIEAKGVEPIKADLDKIAAIKDHTELARVMGEIQLTGTSLPFGWYVNNDAKASTQNALYLGQSGLGLPDKDYYFNKDAKFETIRAEYQKYLVDMLTLAGVAEPAKAAERIYALELKIAEKHWSRVENRDAAKTYNKFSKADLTAKLGAFPWEEYAKVVKLDGVADIIVEQPSYFEAFGAIYKDTDLQTWKDYLSIRFVSEYSGKLSKAFVDRQFAFYGTVLSGTTEQQPRWKKAVNASDEVLGEIVGKLYVEQHFKPEAKERMTVLVDNLIKAYHQSIDTLEWMTPETKKAAHEKLNKFTPKIGYPDKWKDYSSLSIKGDDLVGNYKAAAQFAYSKMTEKLGKPVDRSEWFMTPQTVNAYYNPVNNEIVFPAAILQPPFFNLEADDAVNYGGIGAVIGHELGHGFDDQGAKFDGDGNLRNWWTDADKAEFEKRGKQLVAQYNQYSPLEGMHVNGELTLGENIGDLGGLTVALKAYKLSLNGKEAPVMDGFTGEQRFFLSWSQVWRRKGREEYLRNMLTTDPHSPSEYRVIGIVSNIPEFYDAFNVKPGDKMYIAPENRVKIW